MEKLFKLSSHGSNVRTEITGGLTTFFSMAYIIFLSPGMLRETGMDFHAVMLATCLAGALGCLLTAFLANAPFAQAPGIGLTAFFTYTVCGSMGYTWQQGLAIVLLSGLLFLAVALSPLRHDLIAAIPPFLKSAISAGIGLFIAFVGLLNVGLVSFESGKPALQLVSSGSLNLSGILCLIGLLITAVLMAYKVKGAIFFGIVAATVIGIPMGLTAYSPDEFSFTAISDTFGKLSFAGLLDNGGITALITGVVSFFLVECFDTVGTLIGAASNAGLLDSDGNLPGGDRALIAGAASTCCGAVLGTSAVATFVESSTGIAEGARTGLSSLVTGLMFLLSCFFAPLAGAIPAAATAPALIISGVLMIKGAVNVDWSDIECAVPAFLTVSVMPFTYSISDGIGFGFISFVLIKLLRGKAREIKPLVWAVAALFVVKYVLSSL